MAPSSRAVFMWSERVSGVPQVAEFGVAADRGDRLGVGEARFAQSPDAENRS